MYILFKRKDRFWETYTSFWVRNAFGRVFFYLSQWMHGHCNQLQQDSDTIEVGSITYSTVSPIRETKEY